MSVRFPSDFVVVALPRGSDHWHLLLRDRSKASAERVAASCGMFFGSGGIALVIDVPATCSAERLNDLVRSLPFPEG